MRVELVKKDGFVVGWTLEGENPEEIAKLAVIRNLTFFGMGDTRIVYDGRTGGDNSKGDPGILKWVTAESRKK